MSSAYGHSKSGEREISLDDFKTEDLLDDGMPVSGRNGMISLAGLVGAVGVYAIGRNRGREGYNSKGLPQNKVIKFI